jgi:hypothetical protein
VALEDDLCRQKVDHLLDHFSSQRDKRWFREDLFSGLLRLRGMECQSPTSYAEAFYCRKAVLVNSKSKSNGHRRLTNDLH